MTAHELEQEVAATLADMERAIQAAGVWAGVAAVEFGTMYTGGSTEWSPFFVKQPGIEHPDVARATVHRVGVDLPQTVYITWAEAVPATGEWADLWAARPHTLFRAAALRAAYRATFRDVLGDLAEHRDDTEPAPEAEPVDWLAEVTATTDRAALAALGKRAQATPGAMSPELEVAIRRRRRALVDDPTPTVEVDEVPTPARGGVVEGTELRVVMADGGHLPTPLDFARKIGAAS